MDMPAIGHSATTKREQRFFHFKLEPGDIELMDQLTEDQRAVLLSDGGYRARAEKLNIPLGTLRSRLHRARAALQALREEAAHGQPSPAN